MEQDIIEGNKLIAEFMGYRWPTNSVYTNEEVEQIKKYELNKMKYHTSWDWLMPVYQKIAYVWTNMSAKKQKEVHDIKRALQNRLVLSEINGVFEFSLEFIKWYNANK